MNVSSGSEGVSFMLYPVDNTLPTGHSNLNFTIVSATGPMSPGSQLTYSLNLLDDELIGKARSFETISGNWRTRKTLEYDDFGRVSKILWETETPFLRSGTETFSYAANGLIERVNRYPKIDEYYYQENGRIIRSEEIDNGVKKSYSEYDYDPSGNVGGKAVYYLQSSGQYQLGFVWVYLYCTDGNLHKQLTYIPDKNDEYLLISTRTFDHFINKPNPFPMVEVIPGVVSQTKLPTTYRVQENGVDLSYTLSYQFNSDGLMVRRDVISHSGGESSVYSYY